MTDLRHPDIHLPGGGPVQLAVVVATRDRHEALAALLASLRPQLRPADEVVVVDQSGPAARAANARALADDRVAHLVVDPTGLPDARNRGVRATTAPAVLFLDDDAWALPGCLDAHRAALADPYVGAVAGRIIERRVRGNAAGPRNDLDLGGRVRVDLSPWGPGAVTTVKGANAAFRRAALDAVGGCDPGYGGTAFLEDADWSTRVRRAGWRVAWAPDAAVVHHSAPAGGCRADPRQAEWWRFHNTGRFIRRHRPWTAPAVWLTFSAIAAKRAAAWRDPSAVGTLLAAWVEGWRHGDTGPP
jgi:GT2 family glycosyltransferase